MSLTPRNISSYGPVAIGKNTLRITLSGHCALLRFTREPLGLKPGAARSRADYATLRLVAMAHQELQLMRNLQHPNLALLLPLPPDIQHLGVCRLTPFLEHDLDTATQTVCGPDAAPEQEVLKAASALFSAVAYLHGRGIAHRRIAPTRIRIAQLGNWAQTLMLAGFSAAIRCGAGLTWKEDCKHSQQRFLAPEVIGRGLVNEKMDVWAAAAILASLRLPNRGKTMSDADLHAALYKKQNGALFGHTLVAGLQALPRRRSNASELLNELQHLRSGRKRRRTANPAATSPMEAAHRIAKLHDGFTLLDVENVILGLAEQEHIRAWLQRYLQNARDFGQPVTAAGTAAALASQF